MRTKPRGKERRATLKNKFPTGGCPIGLLGATFLLVILGWGCAPQEPAWTNQVAQGQKMYQTRCARCHGEQGEGKIGPALIGVKHGLAGYQTAQGLFDYTNLVMPFNAPGALQAEEQWAVLAFILRANNLLPPGEILEPDNARSINLSGKSKE